MNEGWIRTAQGALARQGIDAWLLYDFRGSNPLARPFLPLGDGFLSRRVFCLVPREGEPTFLVHAIERGSLPDPGMPVRAYGSRQSLEAELQDLLPRGRVAMEVSPRADVPYVSTVDAGTVQLVESWGAEVVSSAELLQAFAAWSPQELADHRAAARGVMEVLDAAFEGIRARTAAGETVREAEVQAGIAEAFAARGMVAEHGAVVGFGPHSGDPHYAPRPGADRDLRPGDPILIDLFARLDRAGAPYADVTWMGVYGTPEEHFLQVFDLVTGAREAAVQALREAYAEGRRPEGREIDRLVRDHITEAGYGEAFVHRTGHSLGSARVHGDAAHLDDFETRDTRRLVPGLGLTVEPGVYLPAFGVRSELDLVLHEDGPEVTTGEQRDLVQVPLGPQHAP